MQNEVGAECIKGSRKVQTWGCFKVNKMDKKTKEEFEQHIKELIMKGYLEDEVERWLTAFYPVDVLPVMKVKLASAKIL